MDVNDPVIARRLFVKLNQFDNAAFDKVYVHYRPLLSAHVTRLLKDLEEANDLVQEFLINISAANFSNDSVRHKSSVHPFR